MKFLYLPEKASPWIIPPWKRSFFQFKRDLTLLLLSENLSLITQINMQQGLTYSIGIDVGGTNTDAVLMENLSRNVVASVKTATTKDFTTGILQAIQKLFLQNELNEGLVTKVMLGTTAFINALIQNSPDLAPVSVIRIAGPAVNGFEPMFDFPDHLQARLHCKNYKVDGGYEYNGQQISQFDPEQIRQVALDIIKAGKLVSIVIIGVFSPIMQEQNQQELKAAKILIEEFAKANFTSFYLTKSHLIGGVGFLDRENASILNAALKPLAQQTISKFASELQRLNLKNCKEIFLTQNDGTLISCDEALNNPILTLNSGPTNSLRGACSLTKLQNAIVADIGGTTTDVAVLEKGFPKQTSTFVYICGVRTNFRMPNVYSIGLGGGSLVRFTGEGCEVGPVSVGYKLTKEAQCFGGEHLTATDIAVAAGQAAIENASPERVKATAEQIKLAQEEIIRKLANAIDHVKTSAAEVPLILVGGGSILIPETASIPGISKIIKPQQFGVANAIGAAIAQIQAVVEAIDDITGKDPVAVQKKYEEQARAKLEQKGARDNIEVFVHSTQLPYFPGKTIQYQCKAVGNLSENQEQVEQIQSTIRSVVIADQEIEKFQLDKIQEHGAAERELQLLPPKIELIDGVKNWIISEEDSFYMSLGAALLGTGGGGSVYLGHKELVQVLKKGFKPRVIQPKDLKEDEFALLVAGYGAPSTIFEKVSGAQIAVDCVKTMAPILENKLKKKLGAFICAEIGGLNSLIPIVVAAQMNLPVLDVDLMGRAFPEFQMITPNFFGHDLLPVCMGNIQGHQYILTSVPKNDFKEAESFLRKQACDYGCDMAIAGSPMFRQQIMDWGVQFSLSHIWRLGRSIVKARQAKIDPLTVIESELNGRKLFQGKIIMVLNTLTEGYNKGTVIIEGVNEYKQEQLRIEFQNENLVAYREKGEEKVLLASVPDLICVVDTETYQPILTEEVRFGLRVSVLHLPCNSKLRTPQALKVVGPRSFHYNFDYVQTMEGVDAKSIIE